MTTYTDISAEDTIRYIQRIAAHIEADGVNIDAVIAPTRGGLVPGVMMSHRLGVPFFPVSYSLRDHKADVDLPTSLVQFVNDKPHSRVLLIDDIIDTGRTFKGLIERIGDQMPTTAIVFAGLVLNSEQSVAAYTAKTIKRSEDDSWYRFFWELT